MLKRDTLEELYQLRGMSVVEVAKELEVTRDTVLWWMNKYQIPARSRAEASFLKHAKTFAIKSKLNNTEKILYGIGLGLHWGEGNKVSQYSVRLGNTDPAMIIMFTKFLKVICGVTEKDITYGLQVFNDADPQEAIVYWTRVLSCTRDKFHKTISVIPPQGKGTYHNKSKYGVVQVYVNNKKLKHWLMAELANLAEVAQW